MNISVVAFRILGVVMLSLAVMAPTPPGAPVQWVDNNHWYCAV